MFTKFETEVLQTLWREQKPLTKTEIEELAVEKSWKSSTLSYVLNNLMDKGAIEIQGFRRTESKHYARCYIPCLTLEEHLANQINNAQPEASLSGVVSVLLEKRQVSKETVCTLLKMLEDYALSEFGGIS